MHAKLFTLSLLLSATVNAQAELSNEQRLTKLEQDISALKKQPDKLTNGVKFNGLVQMDYNHYDGAFNADNQGVSGSNVFVRRVHIRMGHRSTDELDYVLLLFANDVTTNLLVGFARYQPTEFTEVRVGKLKEDRSLSMQYIGEEVTAERPMMANAFALGFQWGAQAHHLFGPGFRVSTGIFKDGRYAGDNDGLDAKNKLILAYNLRGTWSAEVNGNYTHLGGSYSLREMAGEKFSLSERAGIRKGTNRLALSPELDSADNGNVFLGEFAIQRGAVRFEAEYGQMKVKSASVAQPDISLNGYYATVGYFLDGATHLVYNRKYAKIGRPSTENNTWEIYARYSNLDMVDNSAGSNIDVAMIGTNYYYNRNLHFELQYLYSTLDGPASEEEPFTTSTNDVYNQGNAIAGRMSYRW